jgi:hypothetical protein
MNIFVYGRKYQGKSTLALFLARRIQTNAHGYKVLIFDPKWCFRNVPHSDDVNMFESMLDNKEISEVAYRPGSEEPDATKKDADNEIVMRDFTDFYHAIGMTELLRNPPERPMVIVIDEAMNLKGHPLLQRMMRLATKGKLYLIMACHRPVEIEPTLRAQGDEFYFFNQFEVRDLEVTEEMVGPEVAEITSHLPDHHVLQYKVQSRSYEIWAQPEAWYDDISQPLEEENGIVNAISQS